ncbi:hypothetical protein L917_01719 [Phytophthora nicotianae]|uniref:BZIP domain-containing protein n=1 Tax=Phytophthora nicotianae TaxID=4792 RepID=W2LW79_PHYNI|nr:hypothetical protein L917_01719 [Phytophthora nicotianae]
MASSFLLPPNRFPLSDTVIGGAVQRVAPLHNNNFVGYKRQATNDIVEEEFSLEPKRERKMKVSASRRERCRINQARYRQRQREHENKLNASIQQLQGEIADLEAQRQLIIRRTPTDESAWIVATEYFRLFRHGYMTPKFAPESTSSSTPPQKIRQHVQLDFLKASMASDVTDGVIGGAEGILENWRLFSIFHGDVNVQLKRLQQVTTDSLLATMTISLTITGNTLHQLYPHLVSEGEVSPLGTRLLNQRLVMRGSVRFDWDEASNRVVRLDSKFDMLTPMLQLVGTLENVASVFGQALITPEGKFHSSL